MQEVVDIVTGAARDLSSFNRVEESLVQSAKKSDYPVVSAFERSGSFGRASRSFNDNDASASFAIYAKASDTTFQEVEALFKDLISKAKEKDASIEPIDFQSFDAQMGSTKVRLALFQVQLDTNIQF